MLIFNIQQRLSDSGQSLFAIGMAVAGMVAGDGIVLEGGDFVICLTIICSGALRPVACKLLLIHSLIPE